MISMELCGVWEQNIILCLRLIDVVHHSFHQNGWWVFWCHRKYGSHWIKRRNKKLENFNTNKYIDAKTSHWLLYPWILLKIKFNSLYSSSIAYTISFFSSIYLISSFLFAISYHQFHCQHRFFIYLFIDSSTSLAKITGTSVESYNIFSFFFFVCHFLLYLLFLCCLFHLLLPLLWYSGWSSIIFSVDK